MFFKIKIRDYENRHVHQPIKFYAVEEPFLKLQQHTEKTEQESVKFDAVEEPFFIATAIRKKK